jgi:pyruvate,orthophosphate dikinase
MISRFQNLLSHGSNRTATPRHVDQLLHPCFDAKTSYAKEVVASGLPASPGAAVGQIVFTARDAEAHRVRGLPCILVRNETSAEDVGGMNAAHGILTARGGMTSHAAVVARGWGKPCVVGCGTMKISEAAHTVSFSGGGGTVHVESS